MGLVTIGNLSSDGLIKSINASTAILSGLVQVNALNLSAGKAAVSMKFGQISDSDIEVQGLPGLVDCGEGKCLWQPDQHYGFDWQVQCGGPVG